MSRLPASLGAAAQQLPTLMPRRRRNKARAQRARPQTVCEGNASPSHSFQAQRLSLQQLPSATPRPRAASKRSASFPNGFRALRLALKQLPSPSPPSQAASEPFASPSNSFEAQRLALKQLRLLPERLPSPSPRPQTASKRRSAARPFCKDRAPKIPSPRASSPQNRRVLKVPNSDLCLETSLLATTKWEMATPSPERTNLTKLTLLTLLFGPRVV